MIEVDLNKQLGQRIRYMREARGLTQEALSAEAGISIKHISNLERGIRTVQVSFQFLVNIAKALNMSVHDLVDVSPEGSHEAVLAEIDRLKPYLSEKDATIVLRLMKMLTDR